VVHCNHASILHRYGDIGPQRHWGHDLLTFCKWRHRSREYRSRLGHFPISGQWWSWVYLAQIRRYEASKILESQVWSFGVTWRHR